MRAASVILMSGALCVAACSSSSDVIVTESGATKSPRQAPPTTESSPTTTIGEPIPEPPAGGGDLARFLLVEDDLPGWDVIRPTEVAGEETWSAVDCAPMDIAWAATGQPGMRSRGSSDDMRFRNTAVEYASPEAAAAVLDAVDRVWIDCNPLTSTLGEFWTEPWELPESTYRTSGLLLGGETSAGWILAFWQVDNAIVSLEVEGDDLWSSVDSLIDVAAARIDGRPIDVPIIEPTTTPAPNSTVPGSTVDTTPGTPPSTLPPIVIPTTLPEGPQVFPPVDDDWIDHPLAHIAPDPSEFGDGWRYDGGFLNEAEPADPEDVIANCDAPVPPTLDGYRLDYRLDDPPLEWEYEVIVGQGSVEDAEVLITALRAIADCDLAVDGFGSNYSLSDATVPGAESSVALRSFYDDSEFSFHLSLVVARVGGVHVGAFASAESTVDIEELEAQNVDVIASMLADI